MSPLTLRLLLVAIPFVGLLVAPASADPLAGHRGRERVLLVVASDPADPSVRMQREIFERMGAEARERDLKLVEVLGDASEATTIRRRFGLGAGFHALLIGKDGGAKLTADAALGPDTLLPLIDAMPMRRDEVRRRS